MQKTTLLTLEGLNFFGGIARYVRAIAETYSERVRIYELDPSAGYWGITESIIATYKETDVYLVHHVLPVGTVVWFVSLLTNKPYVIFLHGLDFDLAKRNFRKAWLMKFILSRAKRVVVNSEALKSEVIDWLRAFGQEVIEPLVVYPVVEDSLLIASKTLRKGVGPVELKELLKLAAGNLGVPIVHPNNKITYGPELTLLTVGRLVERKGHLKVLEILERFPELHYQIVGNGPLRERIEAEILHRGLKDRVSMLTNISDDQLPQIYTKADIFVMPTTKSVVDREGFGTVYLEAQLFGLPVIATRTPGVDEAVMDGYGGLLIEDTLDALEAAIRKLIDEPANRSRLGSLGRERVLTNFVRDVQMSKISQLWN